jgi:uncharacterized protein (TIGR02466 family)
MAEFKVHNLWPIPIYDSYIPVKDEWKNKIINLEYERTHVNNSDISKDRNILNSLPDLKKELENHCELFVRKFLRIKNNAKFYLLNSWSNLHSTNESSQIHYHGNSLLSGVYYPIFPKNSGDISFFKTGNHTNIFHQSIRFEYDEDTHVNTEMYKLELDEGKVVIFPSHLEHKVEKNLSKEKRYSIAFNFFVKGKFGREEYILELK